MTKRIRTLQDIKNAVDDRKAVTWQEYKGVTVKPAAWVFNFPASKVYRIIKTGLFIYNKL